MHGKVRSLEQQEAGEIRWLRCADGLSLGSNCVVISWFAEIMRQSKRKPGK